MSQKTPEPTPFERFTEAARHVFNVPKSRVVIATKSDAPKR